MKLDNVDKLLVGVFSLVVATIFWCLVISLACHAAEQKVVAPGNLWKGVFAEAVGEGYEGMVLTAHVYKNRLREGRKMGCCGLLRRDLDSFIAKHNPKYALMAQRAVEEAFKSTEDPTGGATLYENIFRFGWPKDWDPEKVRITTVYKQHVFFREL